MSILLETSLGNITIDLDVQGSPSLCRNVLKLVKVRYYTGCLIYNVQSGRFFQSGDPKADGTGGGSIYGLIDAVRAAARAAGTAMPTTPTTRRRSDGARPTDADADEGGGAATTANDALDWNAALSSSTKRFIRSEGRILDGNELAQKGRVVAVEMGSRGSMRDTVGSQFLITVDGGARGSGRGLDGLSGPCVAGAGATVADNAGTSTGTGTRTYLSLGVVSEDSANVLSRINALYCDPDGRPYADVRIVRASILHDPFPDPDGLDDVLRERGVRLVEVDHDGEQGMPEMALASPEWDVPPEETVEPRIPADEALAGDDDDDADAAAAATINDKDGTEAERKAFARAEVERKKQDKSRAVVLEMLGDLPSADIAPPDNVLFVCKLNPITQDDDLELIFSRFDPDAKAEIVRDRDTGDSLCYAFVEFKTKEACDEAYVKMDNALVDDRRIRVDFSQSVAKVWNRYAQRTRGNGAATNNDMPRYGSADFDGTRRFGGGGGRGGGRGRGHGRGRGRGRDQHVAPSRGTGRGIAPDSGHNRASRWRPIESLPGLRSGTNSTTETRPGAGPGRDGTSDGRLGGDNRGVHDDDDDNHERQRHGDNTERRGQQSIHSRGQRKDGGSRSRRKRDRERSHSRSQGHDWNQSRSRSGSGSGSRSRSRSRDRSGSGNRSRIRYSPSNGHSHRHKRSRDSGRSRSRSRERPRKNRKKDKRDDRGGRHRHRHRHRRDHESERRDGGRRRRGDNSDDDDDDIIDNDDDDSRKHRDRRRRDWVHDRDRDGRNGRRGEDDGRSNRSDEKDGKSADGHGGGDYGRHQSLWQSRDGEYDGGDDENDERMPEEDHHKGRSRGGKNGGDRRRGWRGGESESRDRDSSRYRDRNRDIDRDRVQDRDMDRDRASRDGRSSGGQEISSSRKRQRRNEEEEDPLSSSSLSRKSRTRGRSRSRSRTSDRGGDYR